MDSFAGNMEGQLIGIACGSVGTPLKDHEKRGRTQQQQLKRSCFGCHIDNQYMGVLAYTDDITLMCPSINGLNDMFN